MRVIILEDSLVPDCSDMGLLLVEEFHLGISLYWDLLQWLLDYLKEIKSLSMNIRFIAKVNCYNKEIIDQRQISILFVQSIIKLLWPPALYMSDQIFYSQSVPIPRAITALHPSWKQRWPSTMPDARTWTVLLVDTYICINRSVYSTTHTQSHPIKELFKAHINEAHYSVDNLTLHWFN